MDSNSVLKLRIQSLTILSVSVWSSRYAVCPYNIVTRTWLLIKRMHSSHFMYISRRLCCLCVVAIAAGFLNSQNKVWVNIHVYIRTKLIFMLYMYAWTSSQLRRVYRVLTINKLELGACLNAFVVGHSTTQTSDKSNYRVCVYNWDVCRSMRSSFYWLLHGAPPLNLKSTKIREVKYYMRCVSCRYHKN